MRTFSYFYVCICLAGSLAHSGEPPILRNERPTLINTRDPRPDIIPHPFYQNHTEYRAQYNRPRFSTGWIAYKVSRTSQEAMVWQENYCAGNYDRHHMPPVYKTYYYPKPWEVLNVGARPNFASPVQEFQRVPEGIDVDPADDLKYSEEVKAVGEQGEVREPEKTELVPSPSDQSSSRPTSTKNRSVTPTPKLRKAS